MLRISLACASIAALLAACGQPDPEPETPAAPPAQTATPAPAPEPLPAAEASAVPFTWMGRQLVQSNFISATPSGDSTVLTRAAAGEDNSTGRTTGAHVPYLAPASADFSGLTLLISITASSAADESAPFTAAYSTARKGNSGWQAFEAGTDTETFTFEYEVPSGPVDDVPDFIGISVDDGVSLEVESVSVSLVE